MGIVDELLSANGGELIGSLVGDAGFTTEEAGNFLPPAAEQIVGQVKGGGFDVASLLSGDGASSLISGMDLTSLASLAGIDESKASSGLQSIVPLLMSALQSKAGGASGLLSLLDGDSAGGAVGAALGKLGGSLFNK